jgi:hypothetical protein
MQRRQPGARFKRVRVDRHVRSERFETASGHTATSQAATRDSESTYFAAAAHNNWSAQSDGMPVHAESSWTNGRGQKLFTAYWLPDDLAKTKAVLLWHVGFGGAQA